jgi:hypothetical protein
MLFRWFEFGIFFFFFQLWELHGQIDLWPTLHLRIEQRLVELVCVIPVPLTFRRHARLHDRSPSSNSLAPPYAAPSLGNDCVGYSGPVGGSRWGGGSRLDYGAVVLVVEEVEDVVVGIIKVVGGTARGSSMW